MTASIWACASYGVATALALSPFVASAGQGITPAPAVARLAAGPVGSVHVALPGSSFHSSQSTNWSGYDQGFLEKTAPFTSISADWVVPTATQRTAGEAESSATWIGIGGGCLDTACTMTDSTLVQAGTEQDVAADGTASYSAWWEIVPVPSVSASISVNAGDTIHCVIGQVVPEVWSITLTDETNGQSFTQTVPYASTYLTAEWIEEAPLVVGTSQAGQSTLPNLSTVHFANATVNGADPGFSPGEEIQLVDATGAPVATPSSPGPSGDAFNDCSYSSSCPAP